jgi:hypothetical protein
MADQKKPSRTDEPQSYGSDRDWLEGTTAQTVENTPSRTSRHDEPFYDSSHDAHDASAAQGPADPGTREGTGRGARGAVGPESLGGKKVAESNATRQSYFRNRDYDS